jgi:hypothetical protein
MLTRSTPIVPLPKPVVRDVSMRPSNVLVLEYAWIDTLWRAS